MTEMGNESSSEMILRGAMTGEMPSASRVFKAMPPKLRELAVIGLLGLPAGTFASSVESIANPNSSGQSRFLTGAGGLLGARAGFNMGMNRGMSLAKSLKLSAGLGGAGAVGGAATAYGIKAMVDAYARRKAKDEILDQVKELLHLK